MRSWSVNQIGGIHIDANRKNNNILLIPIRKCIVMEKK